mmetsp:Transcript_40502/g.101748  ORF Transcript_40502/g.101748 Transcript_40502/m.101748 type:complete len:176 (+) Transcript_40502:68-595(+)
MPAGVGVMNRRRSGARLPLGAAAAAAALLVFAGRWAFAAPSSGAEAPLRGISSPGSALRGSPMANGIVAPSMREPAVARGDGEEEFPTVLTGIASVAGLVFGVVTAKAFEVVSDESQVSDGLAAKLSADAGMEDVEDDETSRESELIDGLRKAQGLSEDEVEKLRTKKVKVDDGW